jgi:hypothetical protein
MDHSTIIAKEFVKYAKSSWWNRLPSHRRMKYLTHHPNSMYVHTYKLKDRIIFSDKDGHHLWGTIDDIKRDDDDNVKVTVIDDKTSKPVEVPEEAIVA